MEKFREAFIKNQKFFESFHLHLTIDFPVYRQLDPNLRKTFKIIKFIVEIDKVPTPIYQIQTVDVVSNLKQFENILDKLRSVPYFIGLKLEGIIMRGRPLIEELLSQADFMYFELHKKWSINDLHKLKEDGENMYSLSNDEETIISAKRIYTKDMSIPINELKTHNKIEICVYEEWIDNIELEWTKQKGKHLNLIYLYVNNVDLYKPVY